MALTTETTTNRENRFRLVLSCGETHWALVATALRICSGLVLLPILVVVLKSQDLAFWYAITALGAIANFIDFGMSPTVARAVACYWAGAPEIRPEGISQSTETRGPNLAGVKSVIRAAEKFYPHVAVVMIAIFVLGWYKLRLHTVSLCDLDRSSRLAYIIYAGATALVIISRFYNTALASVGQIKTAQKMTIIAQICYVCVASVGLLMGGRVIWLAISTAIPPVVDLLITRRMLTAQLAGIVNTEEPTSGEVIRSLLPTAWRSFVVSIATYAIYSGNFLIAARYLTSSKVASLGLSLQLATVIGQVAGVFISVNVPRFVYLRTQRRIGELRSVFTTRLTVSVIAYVVGAVIVLLFGSRCLSLIGGRTELLPIGLLATIFAYRLLEFHHVQYGVLVTSGNKVPFIASSLVGAALVLIGSYYGTRYWGLWGFVAGAALGQALSNNWYVVMYGLRDLRKAESAEAYGFAR